MEIKEFGREHEKKIVLIPGCMMCWKQFDKVIPFLARRYHVIAVSTVGFDGTGETTFTTAEKMAEKLAAYISENLDGNVQLYIVLYDIFKIDTVLHDRKIIEIIVRSLAVGLFSLDETLSDIDCERNIYLFETPVTLHSKFCFDAAGKLDDIFS